MPEQHVSTRGTSGWVVWVAVAGVAMMVIGTFHVAQGLTALFFEQTYAVRSSGLLVDAGYAAWGWAHLAVGVLIVVAGFLVFGGRPWARAVGAVMAAVSAVLSIGFLPAFPVGAGALILFDVLVIVALTVHGSEIKSG
jgi:hypothetical protein